MKGIIYLLLGFLVLIDFSGCSKDWLNTTPQGEFLEENFFSNDDQVLQGLSAAYAQLRVQLLDDENIGQEYCSYMLLANLRADDSNVGGQRLGDRPSLEEVGEYTLTSSCIPVYYRWYSCYCGINRCNLVINNSKYTSENLPVYQAEAKYLRAFYYFQLVNFYGDVPLILDELSPSEYDQERMPVKKVFAQIEKDLTEAILILPLKSKRIQAEKNRASKGSAETLLGKIYLTMASPYYNLGIEYYQKSADVLIDVINSDEYQLEPNYDDIWKESHEHGIESIFEIEYSSAVNPGNAWFNGLEASGSVDIRQQGPRLNGISDTLASGWGFNLPSKSLLKAFDDAGDSVRKNGTCLSEDFIIKSGATIVNYPPTYAHAYDKKHTSWLYLLDPKNGDWGWGTNERILRYADVLLMMAEDLNRKSSPDDGQALLYINQVRKRAGLMSLQTTGDQLFEDIKRERRLELAMEGQRLFDLVRWGIAAETMNKQREDDGITDIKAEFQKGVHEHFPIPEIEIVNSNNKLTQNNGY